MIKFLKILGWSTLAIFLLFALLITTIIISAKRDINIAESPQRILKISGLRYSDFLIADSSNNLDRGASAWTSYEYTLQAKTPSELQTKVTKLVDKDSNWKTTESGEYCYSMSDGSTMLTIDISADCTIIKIDYSWWDFFS